MQQAGLLKRMAERERRGRETKGQVKKRKKQKKRAEAKD